MGIYFKKIALQQKNAPSFPNSVRFFMNLQNWCDLKTSITFLVRELSKRECTVRHKRCGLNQPAKIMCKGGFCEKSNRSG